MDARVLKDIVVLSVAVILQLLPVEHELLGGDGKALVLLDLLLDLEDGMKKPISMEKCFPLEVSKKTSMDELLHDRRRSLGLYRRPKFDPNESRFAAHLFLATVSFSHTKNGGFFLIASVTSNDVILQISIVSNVDLVDR